jgi:hypothetical protein
MKSLWIFVGLGPLIVFVIEFFYFIQQWMSVLHLLIVFIVTYVGGAIPAALTCLVYENLAHRVGELNRAYSAGGRVLCHGYGCDLGRAHGLATCGYWRLGRDRRVHLFVAVSEGGMKRLFYFALMMPLAGLYQAMFLSKVFLNTLVPVAPDFWLIFIAVACAFGIAPALICLIVDWMMKGKRDRIIATAVAGTVVALAVNAVVFRAKSGNIVVVAAFCTGVVAALCSWLSSERAA